MRKSSIPLSRPATLAMLAALVAGALVAVVPFARSQAPQVPVAPSYVPIGVAASGSGSTAWFHDPSTRQALACSTTGGAAPAIHCVTARLP